MISKMDPNGARIGIVLNGSPLFNGDAGSGWSNIRKYLLDRDLLDAIIALPKNLFYGTDISSYLWILDNRKPASHKGKVLFVNGVQDSYASLLQRSLGKKRYEVSETGADEIVGLYRDFRDASRTFNGEEVEVAKLMDAEDFLYTKVSVLRPLRDENGNVVKKKGVPQPDKSLSDTERIPMKQDIDEYFKNEVLKFVPDAWMDRKADKIGCEFPFTKLFYKYKPLRSTEEILAELEELDKQMEAQLSDLKNA